MKSARAALLVLAAATAAWAEDPAGEGERLRVQIRGGGTVEGVVLAKGTWERRHPVDGWVAAKRAEKGAGVRLWWVNDIDGFQFVEADEVVATKSLGTVTAQEAADAAKRRKAASERAAAERVRIDEAKAKEADAAEKAKALLEEVEKATQEAEAAKLVDVAKQEDKAKAKRWAELLAQFPPDRWSPDTPSEIERRKVTLHVFPSEDEQAFLKVFDEWKEAWTAWKAAQARAGTAKLSK